MFNGIFKEEGPTSSKRVESFMCVLSGICICVASIWFPGAQSVGLGLVGLGLTGGVAGTLSERRSRQ